jgi:hypothetical protein
MMVWENKVEPKVRQNRARVSKILLEFIDIGLLGFSELYLKRLIAF